MTGLVKLGCKLGCLLAIVSMVSAATLLDNGSSSSSTSNRDDDGFGDEFDVETTTLEVMQQEHMNSPAVVAESDTEAAAAHNNNSMRCWSCTAKYRTWADCQNLNEMEYCENPDVNSCYRSTIRIEGLLGRETRYHRLAGCWMNRTALREAYLEQFEITFGEEGEDEDEGVKLDEFTVCNGSLCNVLDEEALRVGRWRYVQGNLASKGGIFPAASIVAVIFSVLAASYLC